MKRVSICHRPISLVLLGLLLFSTALNADERRNKYDFDPPPPEEAPLSSYLPKDSDGRTELFLSGLGTVCGISFSLIAAGAAVNSGLEDPSAGEFQRDLALTGFCLIGTAVFTVFTDYYLDQYRQKKKSTSKE